MKVSGYFLILLLFTLPSHAQIVTKGLEWVPFQGTLPDAALYGGKYRGERLAVCRCTYAGQLQVGYVQDGKCYFAFQHYGKSSAQFEVLTNPLGLDVQWEPVVNNVPPTVNVFLVGKDGQENVFASSAAHGKDRFPGRLVRNSAGQFECKYHGFAEGERSSDGLRVLTVVPPPDTLACDHVSGVWKWFTDEYINLKANGQMSLFRGETLGTWQCTPGSRMVRFALRDGQSFEMRLAEKPTLLTGIATKGTLMECHKLDKEQVALMKAIPKVEEALDKIKRWLDGG